jgi:hypothetical protein
VEGVGGNAIVALGAWPHNPGGARHAAHGSPVVPLLAALLAGEPLTQDERGAMVLEVLRG